MTEQSWQLVILEKAVKQLRKLDSPEQKRIYEFFEKKVLSSGNPRLFGKQLTDPYKKLWCYRIGNYRIASNLNDSKLTILIVEIGHRREFYKNLSG